MRIRSERRERGPAGGSRPNPRDAVGTLALPMPALTTSVEQLRATRSELHVSIPAAEFEKAIDAAFRKLAGEVKIPGFRPGKAPRQLLEARLGADVAREQALRDALPDYYAEAVESEDLDTIAAPEIDITAGEEGGDVEFDAVVEVRPVVELQRLRRPAGRGPDARTSPTRPSTRRSTRCGTASPTSRTRPRRSPTATTRRSTSRATSTTRSIDALTATDFLYEVGSGHARPEARRGAAREAARRHPEVQRHAARALRRARRRRGRASRCWSRRPSARSSPRSPTSGCRR